MRAPLGNLEGGSFTRDLCVEEASGDGYFSQEGPSTGNFARWLEGSGNGTSLSLCGSSVRAT